MTTTQLGKPYGQLTLASGLQAPWYFVTFDAEGRCTSPEARAGLLAMAQAEGFDHIVIFSHGWNNVWDEVVGLNQQLFAALSPVWASGDWADPPKVMVVSIFWPSVAVLAEGERGPAIAAADDPERQALEGLAASLPEAQAARLRELADRGDLSSAEAAEFVALLEPLLEDGDEVEVAAPSPDDLLRAARAMGRPAEDPTGAVVDPEEDVWGDIGGGPEAAGTLGLSWRLPLRVASVYAMKRRAGVVGARGVAPLLRDLLAAAPDTAVHLAGHSYGCRVVLSAVCAEPLGRRVESLLLLQPAVSRYCFAERVPTTGRPGGYRPALDRVEQPILLTFSQRDAALHKLFSMAMWLANEVGEPEIAGAFDNIYAALGGYGPAGVDFAESPVIAPRGAYALDGRRRILAVDGSNPVGADPSPAINGHGDITSRYTGWMLYSQLRGAAEGRP